MGDFLKALPVVATSPLALVGYCAVLFSWLFASAATFKTKQLFKYIRELPEKDRIKAIEMEYRTLPKKGITAEQWLRARRMLFMMIGFGATLMVFLLLACLMYSYSIKAERVRNSAEELCDLLDHRASRIDWELSGEGSSGPQQRDDVKRSEFLRLHEAVKSAIRKGDLVLAHELENQINILLEPRKPMHLDPVHSKYKLSERPHDVRDYAWNYVEILKGIEYVKFIPIH